MMNADGNGMADSIDEQTESVNKLTVALSNATKAKNAFDEAMKRGSMYREFEQHAREASCNLLQKEVR